MGAEPWSYFAPYRENIAAALEELKQREFSAGRYHKPRGFTGTHATIEEAVAANDADGSRSILDMVGVSDVPRNPDRVDFSDDPMEFDSEEDMMLGLVAPLAPEPLVLLFGTERPTRAMIEANGDY